MKHWHIIQQQPKLKQIFNQPPIVSYRKENLSRTFQSTRKFLQSLTSHKINKAVKQTRREFAYDHFNGLPNKAITHPCVYCNTTESLYFQTRREFVYDHFNCLPKKVITHPCVYCNTTESLYFQIVYVTNVEAVDSQTLLITIFNISCQRQLKRNHPPKRLNVLQRRLLLSLF